LDAYRGKSVSQHLQPDQKLNDKLPLDQFGGWYDLIVTVSGDASFKYQLAGHVETGKASISDPAMGGVVTLKG
jgi:phospholipase C